MTGRGFAAVPSWLVEDEAVSGNAKLVYLVLMSHHSEGGDVFPAHARISALAGISVSTVQRALRELREIGVVDWEQGDAKHGGRGSNNYLIRTTRPRRKAVTLGQGDRPPRSQGPTPSVRVTDELEPENQNQRTGVAEATRAETLLGLEDDGVPRTRGLERDRADVERLAEEAVRLWRTDNPRARIDRTALRTARKLLDDFRTNPDEVLGVLRFALADDFWHDKAHTWASLDRNFASMRRKASTQGPGEALAPDHAATGSPDLAVYFSGSYGDQQREALLLSRSIDPGTFWETGRDQEALLRRALAARPVYPVGSREHHELLLAWQFRGEGQTLRGAVAAWEPVRV